MSIKKEFICFAHGSFEADSPVCPYGCTTAIEREFRTPIMIKSNRTRNIDRTLETLAKEYGYSDLSNAKGSVGASQKQSMQPVWGQVPKGDRFKEGGVIEKVDGSQGGAAAAATASRVHDGDGAHAGFQDVAKLMPQPKPYVESPRFVYGDKQMVVEAAKKS